MNKSENRMRLLINTGLVRDKTRDVFASKDPHKNSPSCSRQFVDWKKAWLSISPCLPSSFRAWNSFEITRISLTDCQLYQFPRNLKIIHTQNQEDFLNFQLNLPLTFNLEDHSIMLKMNLNTFYLTCIRFLKQIF